jgi:hypothetical protein
LWVSFLPVAALRWTGIISFLLMGHINRLEKQCQEFCREDVDISGEACGIDFLIRPMLSRISLGNFDCRTSSVGTRY